MNIKIIEPIGQSETAIRSRLKDLLEKGGHSLFIFDTRGLTDAELIQNVGDADILLLSNRPLSRAVIEACPRLKLICVAFTGIDHVDQDACKARCIILHNAGRLKVHQQREPARNDRSIQRTAVASSRSASSLSASARLSPLS